MVGAWRNWELESLCIPRLLLPQLQWLPAITAPAGMMAASHAARLPSCRGLPAQPIVYNSVLAACEAAQQLEAGLDVLDEMRVRPACCAALRCAVESVEHTASAPDHLPFDAHPLSRLLHITTGADVWRAPGQLHVFHTHVYLPSGRPAGHRAAPVPGDAGRGSSPKHW